MTIYYVGPGGNDGNSGLTWALRKLTINGAEDVPVVAGDIIYVGPGVYRETLTVDVSGGAGNHIVYIADVTGENTDDVGGIVRITGSDNDQTVTRAYCINASSKNYRTFRGFFIDTTTNWMININGCNNWILEDFNIQGGDHTNAYFFIQNDCSSIIIRRCYFNGGHYSGKFVQFYDAAAQRDSTDCLVENCIFDGMATGIHTTRYGGITIKYCIFRHNFVAVRLAIALNPGQTVNAYNCILYGDQNGFHSDPAVGDLIEDYNTIFVESVARNNVATGSHSVAYPPLFTPDVLFDGIVVPFNPFTGLSEWSQVSRRMDAYDDPMWGVHTGISVIEDDLFEIYRPTGVSLQSWGAVQLREGERETGTKRTGDASINLDSAGDHQLFVPVTNISTTFEVYVYREAGYEGLAPQMILRQPGQEDEVVTDTGASGAWNQLTKTITPAADPPYVCVILRSHNTALAGNFDVFFDDLDVS